MNFRLLSKAEQAKVQVRVRPLLALYALAMLEQKEHGEVEVRPGNPLRGFAGRTFGVTRRDKHSFTTLVSCSHQSSKVFVALQPRTQES